MSAINRNLWHSSWSQPSSVGLERSRKLVISNSNVSRLLAIAHQISADNFDKIKSFSTAHSYSLCCKCSPIAVNQLLVVALVLRRLDNGNAVQAGLPSYVHCRLVSILDAAGWALIGRRPIHRSDHLADTLASFQWLRSIERIQFKLANIVYRSLQGTALSYLSSEHRLTDISLDQHDVRPPAWWMSAIELSLLPDLRPWNSLLADMTCTPMHSACISGTDTTIQYRT
jgi:hypothetical protein